MATAADLQALSAGAPGALRVVDLAYEEFAEADLTHTALALPNAVVIRTFSKAWGLAGLRVGYALGPVEIIRWLRTVATNRLTGHSSGFFSGRTMPPNQAVAVETQRKINARLGAEPPRRDVREVLLRKSRSLLRDLTVVERRRLAAAAREARLLVGEAGRLDGIEDGSVQCTVTSPPFLDIVDYAKDNWLRCWFAGIDPNAIRIDIHRTVDQWKAMVRRVLEEQARVLKPGGILAFEVGEVRNGKVLLEEPVWEAAEGLPFKRLGVMINAQQFTKTANLWGVSNGKRGTNTNRIVLLERKP